MSDTDESVESTTPGPSADADAAQPPEVVRPDAISGSSEEQDDDSEVAHESVNEPAKVMRIGSMVKQLLEEVRNASLDEASRERLAEVYERSVVELSSALSPDLREELHMLALPFDDEDVPSEAELRVAKAQLVGWLEGLFHGIQASLMAQQAAAQQQLRQMRQLPEGSGGAGGPMSQQGHGGAPGSEEGDRPGTYL